MFVSSPIVPMEPATLTFLAWDDPADGESNGSTVTISSSNQGDGAYSLSEDTLSPKFDVK